MDRKGNSLFITLFVSFFLALLTVFPVCSQAEAIKGFSDVSRMAAAEGVVLLRNPVCKSEVKVNETGCVLPLKNGISISIFGVVQDYYYSNGSGSGGGVSGIAVDHITTIADGLRTNPNVRVNEELAGVYRQWIKANPFRENGGWTNNVSWSQIEMPLTDAVVTQARSVSQAAVVLIGRTAGEDHEAANIKGSWLLTDTEVDMLNKVCASFDRVVIVLNTGGIIDMSWLNDYPQAAVVYGWQGGMEGGSATADVLTGDITPSGKLVDTIAQRLEDHPAHANATTEIWHSLNYEEDIYIGYRYFETFAPEKIVYPFGFGLSYTTFNTNTDKVVIADDKITVQVTVTNNGKVKGKEVVQVYYGAPQGKLGKPVKQLAAFAKTGVLYPGESQTIEIAFNTRDMASYDDSGVTGHDSCFVMEAGDYPIYVGNDSHTCKLEGVYTLNELLVVKQLQEVLAPTKPLKRMKPGALTASGAYELTYEPVPLRTVDYKQRILDDLPEAIERTNDKKYRLVDVYNGKVSLDGFIAQFTDLDLASVVIGEENNDSSRGTTGAAGCFGAVTKSLEAMGLPLAIAADGPAGIRVNKSVKVTSLPCGTMQACSWNTDLVELLYDLLGQELVLNRVDTILGPGVDLHRYPLGGRNFEYYSEDPLMVGMMAWAATKGVQKHGATPTIKHFAANNLEKYRREINTCVSERALREVYLRGFQIAVENGNVASIMSSYNPINGTWTSSHYDLNTIVLRNEWGFEGVVMTDWWANLGDDQAFYTRAGNGIYGKYMVRAQQDLFMRKDQGVVERDLGQMDHLQALQQGELTLGELQRVAKNICSYLLKSSALARHEGFKYEQKFTSRPDKFTVVKDVTPGTPLVREITINGKSIRAEIFNPLKTEYLVYANGQETMPKVQAKGSGQTRVAIEQASAACPAAVITASEGREERIYKVIFTAADGLEPLLDNAVYARVSELKVNGKAITGFVGDNYYYALGTDSEVLPNVTFKAAKGVVAKKITEPENMIVKIICKSRDQANTYVLQFGKSPASDDFHSQQINKNWKVLNEDQSHWSLGQIPGSLQITAQRGSLWRGENDVKNLVWQEAFGNWQATVKIDLNVQPYENYDGAGIVAFADLDNYIYLKYEYSNGPVIGVFKETQGADPVVIGRLVGDELAEFTRKSKTVYLRLKKIGSTYTGYASVDNVNYISFGSTYADYTRPYFGITASAGGAEPNGEFSAGFDLVNFDLDPQVNTVTLGQEKLVLKPGECEPVAMTSSLRAVACNDTDKGLCLTGGDKGETIIYSLNVVEGGAYRIAARYRANNSNPLAQMSFTVYDNDKLL
ncbi:MAG: glycoside hydrolase family 3 C-terminal domain-containing protein, partial [Sedimentisphaerales bacterium]|nr:glycoside hydrolase family 3 C-terminal domain-containing protein [Sedimentisphaerales bacterium]